MLALRTPDGAAPVRQPGPKHAFSPGRHSTSGRSFSHSVALGLPSSLALAIAACENDTREAGSILGRLPRHARAEISNRRVWCDSLNKVLLAEKPPERIDDPEIYEATMLGLAALGGSVEMVKLLLDAGAVPSHKDSRGRTPLMCTIFAPVDSHEINATNLNYATLSLPKHLEVAEVLLNALAESPNYHDVVDATQDGEQLRGITPLCLASYLGKLALCDALLASGAEVDSGDENGATPLMYAARDGHADVAKLLLSYNARPDLIDRYGWSPIRYAAPFPEVQAVLEQAVINQKLGSIDIQSMFRNAEYVMQEINAITDVSPSRSVTISLRSSPGPSRAPTPGGLGISGVAALDSRFGDLPPMNELLSTQEPGFPLAQMEKLFSDVERLELELQAVEAQRNRLEATVLEKDRQLERMAATGAAVYSAYSKMVDYVNSVLEREEAQAAIASRPPLVAPVFPIAAVPLEVIEAAVEGQTAAPELAVTNVVEEVPALVRKPSSADLRAQAQEHQPEPVPARNHTIFGPAKLGSSNNKSSGFNFRSSLQLLTSSKEKHDGESGFFNFGKHSAKSRAAAAAPQTTTPLIQIPLPLASSSSAVSTAGPPHLPAPSVELTIQSAAVESSPKPSPDGEDAYVERRKKKRQAPILLEYAASPQLADAELAAGDSTVEIALPPRFSSRPNGSSAVSLVDSLSILDWNGSESSLILGPASDIFAAVGFDPAPESTTRSAPTVPEPTKVVSPVLSANAAASSGASTPQTLEAVTSQDIARPKRLRDQPISPVASASMILEARQKLVPVSKGSKPMTYAIPTPANPLSELKMAYDRLSASSSSSSIDTKVEAKRSPPVPRQDAPVWELKPVSPTMGDAKAPAATTVAPKKKRPVVRRAVPRPGVSDFGNLYAYSGAMDESADGSSVNVPTLVDQVSFSFKELKNL